MPDLIRPKLGPYRYSRQKQLVEIAVISLCFVALPQIQGSLSLNIFNPSPIAINPQTAVFSYLSEVLLLAFILWLCLPRLWRQAEIWRFDMAVIAKGIGLAMLLLAVLIAISLILPNAKGAGVPFKRPDQTMGFIWLFLVMTLAVIFEELLFRVYYTERLSRLGLKPYATLAISVPLFAVCHLYQGLFGVLVTGILGLILGLAWLRERSFLLNCLGHLGYNLTVLGLYFHASAQNLAK